MMCTPALARTCASPFMETEEVSVRCDESVAGRLDVALGVGENDSLIFGANLGVIGTDNVAFPARFDGDAIECFDVREFVGGDTGAVAGL